jgi:hypothetical protein
MDSLPQRFICQGGSRIRLEIPPGVIAYSPIEYRVDDRIKRGPRNGLPGPSYLALGIGIFYSLLDNIQFADACPAAANPGENVEPEVLGLDRGEEPDPLKNRIGGTGACSGYRSIPYTLY